LFNELAVGGVLALAALACLKARSLRLDGVALLAIAFAGVGAASAVAGAARFSLSPAQLTVALAYLARWLVYFGVYVVIVNTATTDDARPLWRTYERTALAFAAFGVVQSIFLPGFAQLVFPEDRSGVRWDHQGHRLVSTLLDPNFAGAFVLVPLLVLLARLSFGERVSRWKLALLGTAILLTVSRSTLLALIAGLLVLAAARGVERRLARVLTGAAIVIAPFAPLLLQFAASFNKLRIDDSAMLRFVSWLRALTVLADNPWFGIGFNNYAFVQDAYGFEPLPIGSGFSLDGGVLFIAVMTGVVGAALYFWMIRVVMRRCRAVWRDPAEGAWVRGTALGTAAATVAVLVHSVFVNSLLLPFILEALWLLWGIVFLHAGPRGRRDAATS
jgi:O-antigen ligase